MHGRMSDLTQRAAERFGDLPALTMVGGATFTFRQIDDEVSRFAGMLLALSIRRGERVILCLPNSREWVVAYHALARIGAVVVPTNILLSFNEIAFIHDDSGAVAIIGSPVCCALFVDVAPANPLILIHVSLDSPSSWNLLLGGTRAAPVAVNDDDLFTLGYTSGTTGKPKGAMLSHGNVFSSMALTATIHVKSRGESVLTALPFTHVYGNIVMNAAFLAGMQVYILPRFEAGEALLAITTLRPTIFEGVPAMYYQMLAHPSMSTTDFTSLTRCTVGGQTMPVSKIDEVALRFACPLCELWGMTEVAGPATSSSPYWPARNGSVGLPFPGIETKIVDLLDPTSLVEHGEAGELVIRGITVTSGYWRNTAATEQSLDSDGWFSTGDIAVRDRDGYLKIVDRRTDLIITGGYNVYPAELEQVIAAHPAVSMVAVVAVADEEKGELAKAYVVLRPGEVCEADQLDEYCRQHLARYKVPRQYEFVDDLPKTSTGKIMRRALRPTVTPI